MRYLTLDEVLELHQAIIEQSGGSSGIRDLGALQSAVAQPRMTFAGADLYPTIEEKGAALGFSLIGNHPFVDGNKRVGHAAMETFFVLNGREIKANQDEAEQFILGVAAGEISRNDLVGWLRSHVVAR
ncbi:MAG: type II toxin-antitoxin system death-on-curing family toxin [Thermoguttaceae bacterium]|jgi:death-on-curing protein